MPLSLRKLESHLFECADIIEDAVPTTNDIPGFDLDRLETEEEFLIVTPR